MKPVLHRRPEGSAASGLEGTRRRPVRLSDAVIGDGIVGVKA